MANNKLEAIHYEEIQIKKLNLNKLEELDLANNLIQLQEDLLYCQNFSNLTVLNIAGNPLVTQDADEAKNADKIKDLERLLYVKN